MLTIEQIRRPTAGRALKDLRYKETAFQTSIEEIHNPELIKCLSFFDIPPRIRSGDSESLHSGEPPVTCFIPY
jgi:hypothetical protein